tara:strand:+ start:741 stop:890 length:150 start_codon:yes stop_codon:yes gene_type:complete
MEEKEYEVHVSGVFTILDTSQENAERWVRENLGNGELLNNLEIDDGKQR